MGFIKNLIGILLGQGITIDLSKKRGKDSYNKVNKRERAITSEEESIKTIDDVVTSIFSKGYDVKRDMPLSGKEDDECRCSYIIFDEEDNIKMMIQVVPHNGNRNRKYYNIKKVCEVNDIKFLTFYTHMPNEKSYVEERIKKAL